MRNLILTLACLLVPVGIGVSVLCGQTVIIAADAKAVANLTKVEAVARAWVDAAGKVRVLVELDSKEAREFKFAAVPTAEQIAALRASAIAAKTQAEAAELAAAAAAAQSAKRKKEGKCPACGQALPNVEAPK